ncbi:MAG TPA: molybdopterin-dependent oxidoreductase [Stellaceae bacterium]|jgi:DMSO/TMAO reductase YedYZ molybdopterin-dependent catalytic subunit|nr:molybdopterin-dependent oxidoreductase [Stellaceae bacterium]
MFLAASVVRADTKPVVIDGLVKQRQQVTGDALRRLPSVERQVTFETDHGPQTAIYTGVLLWRLIQRAHVDDPAKWGELRHVLAVTAGDGYLLMVSLGEIDPNFGNAPAMLAYAQDGQPLPTLRLVFPGDKHGARDVRDVVRIEVR